MAIVNCRECGAQVSSEAKACPICGIEYPYQAKLIGSSIEYFFSSLVKITGIVCMVAGLAATLTGYWGWVVGVPLIFVGAVMFVVPGFSASLLICWLIWARTHSDSVEVEAISMPDKIGEEYSTKDSIGNSIKYIKTTKNKCDSNVTYQTKVGKLDILKGDDPSNIIGKYLFINGVRQSVVVSDYCPSIVKNSNGFEYYIFYAGDGGNACDGPFVVMAINNNSYRFHAIESCYGKDNLIKYKALGFNGLSVEFNNPNLGSLR